MKYIYTIAFMAGMISSSSVMASQLHPQDEPSLQRLESEVKKEKFLGEIEGWKLETEIKKEDFQKQSKRFAKDPQVRQKAKQIEKIYDERIKVLGQLEDYVRGESNTKPAVSYGEQMKQLTQQMLTYGKQYAELLAQVQKTDKVAVEKMKKDLEAVEMKMDPDLKDFEIIK